MGRTPTDVGGSFADPVMNMFANYWGTGIIPALFRGVGENYIAGRRNSAAEAARQAQQAFEMQKIAQQEAIKEQARQRDVAGQEVLAKMLQTNPEYMQSIINASPDIFKEYVTLMQNQNAGNYTNKLLPSIGQPTIEGITPTSYQQNVLNNTTDLYKNAPVREGQILKNNITEQTMPSTINATNAKNQANIQYAIPQAKADLQGKILSNQKQQIINKYLPAQQQSTLQGRQLQNQNRAITNSYLPQQQQATLQSKRMTIQKQQQAVQEASRANAFDQVLNKINKEQADPKTFRSMSYELLKNSGMPKKFMDAAVKHIDTLTILKQQGLQSTTPKTAPTGGFLQNLGGMIFGKPKADTNNLGIHF